MALQNHVAGGLSCLASHTKSLREQQPSTTRRGLKLKESWSLALGGEEGEGLPACLVAVPQSRRASCGGNGSRQNGAEESGTMDAQLRAPFVPSRPPTMSAPRDLRK